MRGERGQQGQLRQGQGQRLAVANAPGLDVRSSWQGTLVHVAEVAVAWALVRKRVLFSVIPR